ncbi:molybdate ABC transporter substrate-binding protein [Neptunicella sp. SCSIO 80796]|uniref:molybdate ABC transporter substrate-binding protein n=1 Tax=Neptunicella plasticusilytica TaxID=3117012 RepID=UPI003A4D8EA9
MRRILLGLLAGLGCFSLIAADVSAADNNPLHIAVAANFLGTSKQLVKKFEQHSGHKVQLSFGSTGMLYAQIKHGAPYDIFFAANTAHPQKLEQQQLIVPGSRQTYAMGKLVLWIPKSNDVNQQSLQHWQGKLSIANPDLAPYGQAAMQTLEKAGLLAALQPHIVQGNNVAQAFQFVHSGNATGGFVAASQVLTVPRQQIWSVPASYYQPVEQQLVILKRSGHQALAQQFIDFIFSATGQEMILAAGYQASARKDG